MTLTPCRAVKAFWQAHVCLQEEGIDVLLLIAILEVAPEEEAAQGGQSGPP